MNLLIDIWVIFNFLNGNSEQSYQNVYIMETIALMQQSRSILSILLGIFFISTYINCLNKSACVRVRVRVHVCVCARLLFFIYLLPMETNVLSLQLAS